MTWWTPAIQCGQNWWRQIELIKRKRNIMAHTITINCCHCLVKTFEWIASNYYLIWSRSFPARLRDVWDLYYTKGCKKQEPRMEIHHQQQWECDTPPGEGCCDVIVYYIIIDNKQLSRWCGLVSASALAPVMAWDTCLTQDTWHTWLSADSSTWTRGWWLSLKQARLRWHKCIMLE